MDPTRPTRRRPTGRLPMLTAMAIALSACGAGGQSGGDAAAAVSGSPDDGIAQAAVSIEKSARPAAGDLLKPAASTGPTATNTAGRLLASNCFQCHGTGGAGGFENIRGQEASEVLEFMSKPAGRSIMAAHAQGYTPAQLQSIIAYLQR